MVVPDPVVLLAALIDIKKSKRLQRVHLATIKLTKNSIKWGTFLLDILYNIIFNLD